MGRRLALIGLTAVTFGVAAVAAFGPSAGAPAGSSPALREVPADTTFAALVRRLSGAGAYFDTDNLISNEASYLHVAARLRALRRPGLAYIGVGPDQNFSYIAALRPEFAVILDIRRDNLLHHLLLKALLESSPDRASYLAALFGRPPPPAPLRAAGADLGAMLEWARAAPAVEGAALPEPLERRIVDFGVELSQEDIATIRGFHRAFIEAGPELRFRSHGRAPRWYYPTYGELLLERDERDEPASYLATDADFHFVRALQERDGIVPAVGDFSGPHALPEIGRELRRRGLEVGAFYTSNVEFYLYEQGTFDRYAASVAGLPAAPDGVLVRSYFHRGRPHPESVAGYASTQLAQPLEAFVTGWRSGGFPWYGRLVSGE
ncbi:MAG: hypothetical protein ABFS34_01935 [Gemmatimonadota bacterium]